jgi:hypothetical protein
MRLEIGNQMTTVEALEIIRNNNEGVFVCENGKIYFQTDKTPVLINQHLITPQYQQPQKKNIGVAMGDMLNQMCGVK